MKNLFSIIARLVLISVIVTVGFSFVLNSRPDVAKAVGDLTATFPTSPFFNETNMAPGDVITKTVTVENSGTIMRLVAMQAANILHTPPNAPFLDDVLIIGIKEGATTLFGPVTLSTFLNDADGITLNTINGSETKLYDVTVTFPSSAGNEYQAKQVMFDLSVGAELNETLVINEVFFFVDQGHTGPLSVIARLTNRNTGPNSTNINRVSVTGSNDCTDGSNNKAKINTNVNANLNTGGNTVNGNTQVGNVSTGAIRGNISVNNTANANSSVGISGRCDEWIELYNPTDSPISLKNWKISDDSGVERKINANKIIQPGKFALLVKSKSTFTKVWNEPSGTLIVELGLPIGNGLGDAGDHVRLVDPTNADIDSISWGTDLLSPHYAGTLAEGHSIERAITGVDNDEGTDFVDRFPPTPGS